MSNYAAVKACRRRLKIRCVEYLGGRCKKCGYDRCLRALQFHHIHREDKAEALYVLIANNRPWDVIVLELEKCVLLCSNCHAEVEDAYDKGLVLVFVGDTAVYASVERTHEEDVPGEQVFCRTGESLCRRRPHTTTRKPSRD